MAWLLLMLVSCAQDKPALPHEAYIWQRQWTPELANALQQQGASFSGWRLLLLQVIDQQVRTVEPDFAALQASAKPLRWVVRIEGSRNPLPAATLMTHLQPLVERWKQQGLEPLGLEIDHDCATAALADYAVWLQQLRALLPANWELSITALPTWIDSPQLDAVLAQVHSSVLQVHAVDRPDRQLFDADQALLWAHAYAQRTPSFLLALPAYGVRVATSDDGRVIAVDAETDVEYSGASGRELHADPRQVAKFKHAVEQEQLAGLHGWIWFRLPLPSDRRSWSSSTLAAVIADDKSPVRWRVQPRANSAGSFDLRLINSGLWDAPMPSVNLPDSCRLADALGPYRLRDDAAHLQLHPASDRWLRSGESVLIGWTRCSIPLTSSWDLP